MRPLSDFPKATVTFFAGDLASLDPGVALQVLRVIAGWSLLEAEQGRVAAKYLRAEPRMVAAMFGSIQASGTRAAELEVLAGLRLSSEDFELFKRVNGQLSSARSFRNDLAHDIYGVVSQPGSETPQIPRPYLALVDPQYVVPNVVEFQIQFFPDGKPSPTTETRPPVFVDMAKVAIYTMDDLRAEADLSESAVTQMRLLGDLAAPAEQSQTARSDLSDPRFGQLVKSLRPNRQEARRPLGSPPPERPHQP